MTEVDGKFLTAVGYMYIQVLDNNNNNNNNTNDNVYGAVIATQSL